MEISEFRPEEIDEAIDGLDGLQEIIAPVLRKLNVDGMGEQDVQQFVRQLTLAKHALIAMGNFLEGKITESEAFNTPLTLKELRELGREPVWLQSGALDHYDIFTGFTTFGLAQFYTAALPSETYGKTWWAYRRKPEEGTV